MKKQATSESDLHQQIKDHSRKTGIPFHLWILGAKPADRRIIRKKIKTQTPDLHRDFRDELLS